MLHPRHVIRVTHSRRTGAADARTRTGSRTRTASRAGWVPGLGATPDSAEPRAQSVPGPPRTRSSSTDRPGTVSSVPAGCAVPGGADWSSREVSTTIS